MYTPVINENFAWACGLFEGEGYFDTHGNTRRLNLTTTDKDVLVRFQKAVGCGSITLRKTQKKSHWKQQFIWREGRRAYVTPLLEAMLPFLGKRRKKQAQILLDKKAKREWPNPKVEACGFTKKNSPNGYSRHKYLNEEVCRACLDAAAEYQRNQRAKRKKVLR